MVYLKGERDYLITGIINEINLVILYNIHRQKYLSNLKNIFKLDFLNNIDEILEIQYEVYQDEVLVNLKNKIYDVINTFKDCINCTDNYKVIESTKYQLCLIESLQESLFESIEDSFSYNNLLEYISHEGKLFRDNLPNFSYKFNEEMNKVFNKWNYDIRNNKNTMYVKAKDLLILK